MDPIRTVIVDDEREARDGVRALVERLDGFLVVGVCAGGRSALRVLQEQPVDLLLLDVQMPVVDGFAVLKTLAPGPMPEVVFMTAFDRYALDAFEANALDYLLKPFTDERFDRAMARARERVRQRRLGDWSRGLLDLLAEAPGTRDRGPAPPSPTAGGADRSRTLSRILVRDRGSILFIDVADIDFVAAANVYAEIHVGGKTHLLRETLKKLEKSLPPGFVRIHRSWIVNLRRVARVKPDGRDGLRVVLADGTSLPVSQSRRREVRRALRRLARPD